FSMAGTNSEVGPLTPANEPPNNFLGDHRRPGSRTFAFAVPADSKGRRPQGSGLALYKRNYRSAKARCDQPPQPCRKRLAIPGTARRKENRRHPRVTALLSHVRIDGHSLVSAH